MTEFLNDQGLVTIAGGIDALKAQIDNQAPTMASGTLVCTLEDGMQPATACEQFMSAWAREYYAIAGRLAHAADGCRSLAASLQCVDFQASAALATK